VPLTSSPAIQVTKHGSPKPALVGQTISYSYTVTNVGNVTLSTVTLTDNKLGPITLGTTTLAPGTSTTGTKTYAVKDSDLPGPIVNTATTAGQPPVGNPVTNTDDESVPITPNEPPDIALSPNIISFGDGCIQGPGSSMTVSVCNNGGQQLLVVASLTGTDASLFSIHPSSLQINSGGCQTIAVSFHPTSIGHKEATLALASNDPDQSYKTVSLAGYGCSSCDCADIVVDPSTWNFGSIVAGNSKDKIFAISNIGCENLAVTSMAITGTDASQFFVVSGGGDRKSVV
jgi:uncharacterized repeat protein (TIGR01451 family)